ncbi:hypothetical protein HLPCO_000771 [Haloplasma contractile SSD-17B]|uniref:Uncharacterized protein n=1 Tax=Haloplasma contractile SSD-17B TaxID=1033810 RepID=U2DY13_9MOLU|nr:hypothetical protein HLPCO_000771 [Haloplasma contractile SSD-17B]
MKQEHVHFPDFLDVWLFREDIDLRTIQFHLYEVCDTK